MVKLVDFIEKLGHNLVEIRFNAIDKILFKLNNEIVSINECLINQDTNESTKLLFFLIEWLKNDINRPKFEDAMQIIHKIVLYFSNVGIESNDNDNTNNNDTTNETHTKIKLLKTETIKYLLK